MAARPSDAGSLGQRTRNRTTSGELERTLLDTADEILARDGLAGVTIRAVAQEAGVAPMGVYNRFGSKEGLMQAVALRAIAAFGAALSVTDPDPVTAFTETCWAYRRFALTHEHYYRLLFRDQTQFVGGTTTVIDAGRAVFSRFAEVVGAVSGRSGADLENAQAVWSAMHGAVSLELDDLAQYDTASSYGTLIGLLTAGLAVGEVDARP